jgi:hypothetical protein
MRNDGVGELQYPRAALQQIVCVDDLTTRKLKHVRIAQQPCEKGLDRCLPVHQVHPFDAVVPLPKKTQHTT